MDSHKHSLVIFDEGAKEYNGAKVISQQMVSWTTGHPHAKG